MITSLDFKRLVYRKPKLSDNRGRIVRVFGIDSEAYIDGTPFMFAVSTGEVLLPWMLPDVFFEDRYVGGHFMVYNLKYDSGAFLRHLPRQVMHELWEAGEVKHEDTGYRYIPHKQLRLRRGHSYVYFWDISQFYHMSLDNAARTYLRRGKIDMRTKRFTPGYVERYWRAIARYCIMDAKLTEELGRYLIEKLSEFGIVASSLYSCASIAFKYFCTHSRVVTSWRFWKHNRGLLEAACDAYEGGKFEVTQRGRFEGHEYDIVSAYPCEIRNLVDVSDAEVERAPVYREDAVYGYIRCRIDNSAGLHLPCGMMIKATRIYPAGVYYLSVTKAEYEYMALELGLDVEILDAWWLYVKTRRYPYRKPVDYLFSLKSRYKGKDRMLYNVTKIVMNSYYGKMAQCIENRDGSVTAGPGWNPVYASVITANTRIKVARLQNLLGDRCLAVHTDSIICTERLPKRLVKGTLGELEYVTGGEGTVIACGMYQIGDQAAFRSFIPRKDETWFKILRRYRHQTKIPYPQLNVESWREAMARNHPQKKINVFVNEPKEIDLNCDVKRKWIGDRPAEWFLKYNETSLPHIRVETCPPKYWNI